jgi:hypothetical protein
MNRHAAYPVLPLAVLRLTGSQVEMGRQHGALQRTLGGHEAALDYYRDMPVHMLKGSQPAGALRTLPHWLAPAIDALTRRLDMDRPTLLRQRSEAYMLALGLPRSRARQVLAMDVFQNLVGVAGRLRIVPLADRVAAQAVPACSSLVLWGQASRHANLLHARNFDFPGVGIWDAAPTVVLCTPDVGMRYGFASTRGADAPVVSLWNEAGLCLTTHTRLHRDVRFAGAAIVDLCHDVIRQARTCAQAEAIVRERPIASTWGLLVSSTAEQTAVLIETTARGVAVTRPEPADRSLACTNHYLANALQPGELAPNLGYTAHSHGRRARLLRAVREAMPGGLDATDLQALLGDHEDGEQAGVERGAGGVLAQPTGVHSIVMDPQGQRSFVSIGVAPAGRGGYAEVAWDWTRDSGMDLVAPDQTSPPPRRPSRFDSGAGQQGYGHFLRAVQLETQGAEPAATAIHIARAAAADPEEPTWQLLHAGFAMRSGDDAEAGAALARALDCEHAPFYRARLLLWATRLAQVCGRSDEARQHRDDLQALTHPLCAPLQEVARREAIHPYDRAQLRQVPIQCFMGAVG